MGEDIGIQESEGGFRQLWGQEFFFFQNLSYPFPPPAEYNLSQKVSCCSELAIV